MCGIAGRFNFDPLHRVSRTRLIAMTDEVRHRGPDAGGYYIDGAIGLGHRRPFASGSNMPYACLNAYALWQLTMLELWFRTFIDNAGKPADTAIEAGSTATVPAPLTA